MHRTITNTCLLQTIKRLLLLCALPSLSLASDQQDYAKAMLVALENDDVASFHAILKSGGDPTLMIDNDGGPVWVMCQAADHESTDYIKLIAEEGWNLDFRHDRLASDFFDSQFETALFCSISSLSVEPFKYLVRAGVDVHTEQCHRCGREDSKQNLLENVIWMARFELAFWILEHTSFGASMVTEDAIAYLNIPGTSIRETQKPWFMKTVYALRDMGYQVETDYTRLVEKPDSVGD